MTIFTSPTQMFDASVAARLQWHSPGDTVFVSPQLALFGSGASEEISVRGHDAALAAASGWLQQLQADACRRGIVFGALPFYPDGMAHLRIPRLLEMLPGPVVSDRTHTRSQITPRLPARITSMQPAPTAYQALVEKLLAAIAGGALQKAVAARALTLEARVDLPTLLPRLLQINPNGFNFTFTRPNGGATLVGASPELLIRKRGLKLFSNPLAGSLPRHPNPAENTILKERLLTSPKDRHEHALVVDAISSTLAPFCRHLHVPATPAVVETATMLHLSTEIHGELLDDQINSLGLALALHPTPAVSGFPQAAAMQLLRAHEGLERDLYAGLIGWMNTDGDGEWAIALRCADVTEQHLTLYAGAGIVTGSDPKLELAETSAKMRTLLNALGIDQVLELERQGETCR